MKKFVSMLLALVMVFALCACGSKTGTTAPGVRNWPGTHLLGDDVEITDPLAA